jgi:hypothetical protein
VVPDSDSSKSQTLNFLVSGLPDIKIFDGKAYANIIYSISFLIPPNDLTNLPVFISNTLTKALDDPAAIL